MSYVTTQCLAFCLSSSVVIAGCAEAPNETTRTESTICGWSITFDINVYIYTHTHRTRCTVCSSISLVHFFSPHFFIIIIPIYLYDDDGCYTTGCLSIVIEPTLSWPLLGNTHQFDKPLANDTCFLAAVAMRMLRRRLFCVCVCVLSLDTTQSSLSSVAFLILCRI